MKRAARIIHAATAQLFLAAAVHLVAAGITVDFENHGEGRYTETMMVEDFDGLGWNNGLDEGRATVVTDDEQGKVLRVHYPEGAVGANRGGVQFKCKLGATTDAACAEYRLKFQEGFDFVKGGKLPGLCGGQCNTGGDKCSGTDGWSARYMWRRQGKAVVYLYDMTMQSYGTDIELNHPALFHFEPGRWYTIRQCIEMNDPGIRNGNVRVWIDGEQMLDYKYAKFRSAESLGINLFYFSTFFGGGSADWAPTKDECIYYDDIRAWDATSGISTESRHPARHPAVAVSVHEGRVIVRTAAQPVCATLYDCHGVRVSAASGVNPALPTGRLAPGSYVLAITGGSDTIDRFPIVLTTSQRQH